MSRHPNQSIGHDEDAAVHQGSRWVSLSDRILLSLFRRFPPRDGDSIFKESVPRPSVEYAAECASPFSEWFPTVNGLFVGRVVLDLGCGYGGRTLRFIDQGATSVVGVEVTQEKVDLATSFAAERGRGEVQFRLGTGEDIPSDDAAFDLITMFDVLEHVVDPARTLAECYRVLRPGGRLATVFPPYYSATGGSHLHGYATKLPGLQLVFTTKALRRASMARFEEQQIAFERYLRDEPSDKLWNTNGLTIRRFNRIVDSVGFRREVLEYHGDFDHRTPGTRGAGRLGVFRRPPFSLVLSVPARVPGLREAACSRVVALLRK